MENNKLGKLYMIPSTLGDSAPLEVLPISIKRAIEHINHYIVENEKTARHFIKKVSPRKSQSTLQLFALNKFTEISEIPNFLKPCLEGIDMGVLSEAGCPAIADPGAAVVAVAHEKGIQVVPLVGPSAIVLALMASGLNGQNFAFNGYLPIDANDRKREIKRLEKRSKEEYQSQLFIETPYRNNKLIEEMLKLLAPSTRLCIAVDITLQSETIQTKTVQEWRNHSMNIHKRPAILIFQA